MSQRPRRSLTWWWQRLQRKGGRRRRQWTRRSRQRCRRKRPQSPRRQLRIQVLPQHTLYRCLSLPHSLTPPPTRPPSSPHPAPPSVSISAEAERLLKIKEAAEAKGDAPAEGLVEEDAYLFVVFDGGDKSIAEVRLKKGATWPEMKVRSRVKLSMDLGFQRDRY